MKKFSVQTVIEDLKAKVLQKKTSDIQKKKRYGHFVNISIQCRSNSSTGTKDFVVEDCFVIENCYWSSPKRWYRQFGRIFRLICKIEGTWTDVVVFWKRFFYWKFGLLRDQFLSRWNWASRRLIVENQHSRFEKKQVELVRMRKLRQSYRYFKPKRFLFETPTCKTCWLNNFSYNDNGRAGLCEFKSSRKVLKNNNLDLL